MPSEWVKEITMIYLLLVNDAVQIDAIVAFIVFATFAKQFLKIRMTSSDINLLFVQNSPIFLVFFLRTAQRPTQKAVQFFLYFAVSLNEPQIFEEKPINYQWNNLSQYPLFFVSNLFSKRLVNSHLNSFKIRQ